MNNGVHIATYFAASEETVDFVLGKPVTDDGRSDFVWVRLGNGDLILGVFPRGETYEHIEGAVDADYMAAKPGAPDSALHTIWDEEQ